MNRVVIYQPYYFPKLHYLARVNKAQEFIIFDDVKLMTPSEHHRTEIEFGSKQWLTVPIRGSGNVQIKDAEVNTTERWPDQHYKTLKHKYGQGVEIFEKYYNTWARQDELKLTEVTVPLLKELLVHFEIDVNIRRSSEIDIHGADASEYLARLTEWVDGDQYFCGRTAYDAYLDESAFKSRNIELQIQDWEPQWPDGNAVCLDVLFNSETPEEYVQ